MDRTLLLVGAAAAFIGVAFGAFGAHGLRGRLSPEMLAVFETGVRYQMYHALGILVTAVALGFLDDRLVRLGGWMFTLGMITPLGGLAFLAGWALLIVAALRH